MDESPSTPRNQYTSSYGMRGESPGSRYVDSRAAASPYSAHWSASPPRAHHATTFTPSVPVYDAPPVAVQRQPTPVNQRWVSTGTYAPSTYVDEPKPVTVPARSSYATTTTTSAPTSRAKRSPSMIKDPLATFLPPQHPTETHRLCLALDLDETLVYARDGPVHVRPFARELLRHLFDLDCEVIVWTAGERDYAQSVIRQLDPLGTIEHCVYRHQKWWTGQMGYSKNLRALGRNLSRTLLVDNTPDCLKDQPQNGLLVSDFEGPKAYDDCLRSLLRVVQAIVDRPHESVPRILADCPEVVRRVVPLDAGGNTNVWTLSDDDVVGRQDYQSARYNRDSPQRQRSPSRGRW